MDGPTIKKLTVLIQKLENEHQNVKKLWRQWRKSDSPVKKILVAFQPNQNYSFIYQNQAQREIVQTVFRNAGTNQYQDSLTKLKNYFKSKGWFKLVGKGDNSQKQNIPSIKNSQKEKSNVINQQLMPKPAEQKLAQEHQQNLQNEQQCQQINGNQILLTVKFNTKKLDPNYRYKIFNFRKQIQAFIKTQIKQKIFKVTHSIKSLKILQGKQQFKDNYTGTYVFDPFFNCVKIFISKTSRGSFQKSFRVVNINDIKFNFDEPFNQKDWIDEQSFNVNDSICKLIDYICQKEDAPPETAGSLKQIIQNHGMKIINDLMYNTEEFLKNIGQRKWANQIQSEIQKIRSPQPKRFTGNENIDPEKIDCYKIGNYHKILRYVYYKSNNETGNGLKILNKQIPKINLQLMKKAINIVRNQLMIQGLFDDLENYFMAFSIVPRGSKYEPPHGVLFYGPPGTGKTRLTEDLAELMGFHLVSNGLSSAQFMKELVGQAKGTVHSYLRRATISPHLVCSLAIDEIDSIVVDRRNKESKSSAQTTAMFLSGLGGNQGVQNILVLGSTNLRNEIDDAILRRFTPDFYVGLPNNQIRKKIIHYYLDYLDQNSSQVQFISLITPNYSGAALKTLCQMYMLRMRNSESVLRQSHNQIKFSNEKLIEIAKSVGIYYKIKFGDETYPHLYERISKELSINFIQKAYNKLVIIQKQNKNSKFKLVYAKAQPKWTGQKIEYFIDTKQIDLNLSQSCYGSQFNYFCNWISRSNQDIKIFTIQNQRQSLSYYKNYSKPTILIIKIKNQAFLHQNIFLQQPKDNLFVVFYVQGIKGTFCYELNLTVVNNKIYKGRILVPLQKKGESEMNFQLDTKNGYPIQIQRRPFLQIGSVVLSKDALPEIGEFLMSQEVNYIQMINGQLLSDNNAFTQDKIFNVINYKIQEAKHYSKSSIIVQLDSLISVNRSISYSENKQNVSTSINQVTLYRKLIQLFKNFAEITPSSKKWIVYIIEDEELLKMVKRDAKWPELPEQQLKKFDLRKQQELEKRKQQNRSCFKCSQIYTQEQNTKQKNCLQHYGVFVDEQYFNLHNNLTQEQARFDEYKINVGVREEKDKKRFLYSCCWQPIGSQACQKFQHWGGYEGQTVQHAITLRQSKYPQWEKRCQILKQAVLNIANNMLNDVQSNNYYEYGSGEQYEGGEQYMGVNINPVNQNARRENKSKNKR